MGELNHPLMGNGQRIRYCNLDPAQRGGGLIRRRGRGDSKRLLASLRWEAAGRGRASGRGREGGCIRQLNQGHSTHPSNQRIQAIGQRLLAQCSCANNEYGCITTPGRRTAVVMKDAGDIRQPYVATISDTSRLLLAAAGASLRPGVGRASRRSPHATPVFCGGAPSWGTAQELYSQHTPHPRPRIQLATKSCIGCPGQQPG